MTPRRCEQPTYRLDAHCPHCGAPPPVQVPLSEVEEKRKLPPETLIQTVRCGPCAARRRIVTYPITAEAYHGAA